MSWKSVIDNYKEHGLKYFTVKRAKLFLRSLIRKVTGFRLRNESDAIVFGEIVTYKSLTCPDCAQAGQCRVCKCPINELFTAMDVGCSDDKFPSFQRKRDWDIIKYNVKKGDFKAAWNEFRNTKHWRDGWKEYKEKNGIYFLKYYS